MYIKVKVKTKQKKEEIITKSKDHFEISLKEKPERNLANKRLIEVLSKHFSVSLNKVRLISGHHSPSKILSVEIHEKNQ